MITEKQKEKQVKIELRKTELAIILHNNCTIDELEAIKKVIERGFSFYKFIEIEENVKTLLQLEEHCIPSKPHDNTSDEFAIYKNINSAFYQLKKLTAK